MYSLNREFSKGMSSTLIAFAGFSFWSSSSVVFEYLLGNCTREPVAVERFELMLLEGSRGSVEKGSDNWRMRPAGDANDTRGVALPKGCWRLSLMVELEGWRGFLNAKAERGTCGSLQAFFDEEGRRAPSIVGVEYGLYTGSVETSKMSSNDPVFEVNFKVSMKNFDFNAARIDVLSGFLILQTSLTKSWISLHVPKGRMRSGCDPNTTK